MPPCPAEWRLANLSSIADAAGLSTPHYSPLQPKFPFPHLCTAAPLTPCSLTGCHAANRRSRTPSSYLDFRTLARLYTASLYPITRLCSQHDLHRKIEDSWGSPPGCLMCISRCWRECSAT